MLEIIKVKDRIQQAEVALFMKTFLSCSNYISAEKDKKRSVNTSVFISTIMPFMDVDCKDIIQEIAGSLHYMVLCMYFKSKLTDSHTIWRCWKECEHTFKKLQLESIYTVKRFLKLSLQAEEKGREGEPS